MKGRRDMAIISVKDVMQSLSDYTKDRTDDVTLKFVEDMTDTINDLNSNAGTDWNKKLSDKDAEWQEKLNQKDNEWRVKYRERFFQQEKNSDPDLDNDPPHETPKKLKFEDLFTYQ